MNGHDFVRLVEAVLVSKPVASLFLVGLVMLLLVQICGDELGKLGVLFAAHFLRLID